MMDTLLARGPNISARLAGEFDAVGNSARHERRNALRLLRPTPFQLGPNTWRPPRKVRSTQMSFSRLTSQESGSSVRTAMAATLPTPNDPYRSSFQLRRW